MYMIKVNYFIAVCFNNTGVSSLQMAITPKHVAANQHWKTQNRQ